MRHRSGAGTVRLPVVLAPVDSSAPLVIPGAGHILEYVLGGGEVIHIAGQIVSVNPGQGPPALIIVVGVGEARVEGAAGREKRLAQEPVSLYWPVSAWSLCERVLHNGCQVGTITGDQHVVDYRGEGVSADPPTGRVLNAVALGGEGDCAVDEVAAGLPQVLRVPPVDIHKRIVVGVEAELLGVRVRSVPLLQCLYHHWGNGLDVLHSPINPLRMRSRDTGYPLIILLRPVA